MDSLLMLLLLLLPLGRGNNLDDFPGLEKILLPASAHMRVVGGEATTIDKLGGYIVALRYLGNFVCGGALLNERIVLSAAHCFIGRQKRYQWTIEGGISRLDENGTKVVLKEYIVPSIFDEDTMHMDVAVLLLSEPLKGKNIVPIALCNHHLIEGRDLTVSGWGLTDPRATLVQQQLRTVIVPVVKKSKCKKVYKKSSKITDAMFCAGLKSGKDACTFDSGGPLVYYPPNAEKQLCGIVSFGIGCASVKYPGVYTDVNYVKPFILASIDTLNSLP
ncbi:seminase [Drosophila grimshawi]|uniref:GH15562 n=1 Tax=Drosophila grimshawi TaxID=7222 RepID=B4J1D0_DROGR|nr:seminase [Drosophila grimshawi]EDV95821.1 GH15562 [Drosophila grimshawi]